MMAASPLAAQPALPQVFDTRQECLEQATTRAVAHYSSCGALILTEDLSIPPALWRRDILSKREKERLGNFLFDRDRQLYLAAHSLKRLVLAGITQRSPQELEFATGASGRPFLLVGGWQGDFNLSHSGNRVALAVVSRGRVGVDVQEPGDRYSDLHEKLRHPEEAALFPDRSSFLRMWTLKEAVSKAIGTGLAEKFETLRMHPSERIPSQYHCNGWTCRHGTGDDGYHLAVATDFVRMPGQPLQIEALMQG